MRNQCDDRAKGEVIRVRIIPKLEMYDTMPPIKGVTDGYESKTMMINN